jgi:type IV pilus assembly protein PilM
MCALALANLASAAKRLPHRSSRGWIGIDIGSRAIKVAQVERAQGTMRIVESLVLEDDAQSVLDEQNRLAAWAPLALEALLRSATHAAGKTAACTLSVSATESRTIEVPLASEAEMRGMIAQELEVVEDGESSPGSREFDYWVIDDPGRSDSAELALVGAISMPSALAESVGRSLLRCGLRCEVLDAAPWSVSRAVGLTASPPSEQPTAVLDWGASTAMLTVVQHGQPVFTRNLRNCPFRRVSQAIQNGLGATGDECCELLNNYGVAVGGADDGDVARVVSELISDTIQALVEEVNKTLSYLKGQRSSIAPEKLWLTGGGATVRNFDTLLSARLGLATASWEMPRADEAARAAPTSLFAQAAALSALKWSIS